MAKSRRKRPKDAPATAPNGDDTVIHLGAKSRSTIGSAVGAAIGSVLGSMFAENPDGFMQQVAALFSAKGIVMPTTNPFPEPGPTVAWWSKKVPGVWYAVLQDGKEHAFSVELTGSSACGDVQLKEHLFLAPTNGRCSKCENTLRFAGYTVDGTGATQPPTSPPTPKRAKKAKTA